MAFEALAGAIGTVAANAGIWRRDTSGAWTQVLTGPGGNWADSIQSYVNDTGLLYAQLSNLDYYKSTDKGLTWSTTGGDITFLIGNNSPRGWVEDGGAFYATSMETAPGAGEPAKGVAVSTDEGVTWTLAQAITFANAVAQIYCVWASHGKLYWQEYDPVGVGSADDVHRINYYDGSSVTSFDYAQGVPFKQGRQGIRGTYLAPIVYAWDSDPALPAPTWNYIKIVDGTPTTLTQPIGSSRGIQNITPIDEDIAFVQTIRTPLQLWRTQDGGANWTNVLEDTRLLSIDDFQKTIAFDWNNPDVIIVSGNGGVFVSEDGGDNWAFETISGIGAVPVVSIVSTPPLLAIAGSLDFSGALSLVEIPAAAAEGYMFGSVIM